MNEYAVDKDSGQYKAPFNTITNEPKVYTPADTAIVTPNSDTPYSWLFLDLRAEPVVLCVPEIEKDRYYSVMLTSQYTFNFGYIGSRATGNERRLLCGRRTGLEGRHAQRRQEGLHLRDGVRARDLPDPALQCGRHRQREGDPGQVSRSSRCRLFSASRRRPAAAAVEWPKIDKATEKKDPSATWPSCSSSPQRPVPRPSRFRCARSSRASASRRASHSRRSR